MHNLAKSLDEVARFDFSNLISIDNLFQAWNEFKRGKRNKRDVQIFERNLEDNLFTLHNALKNKSYKHGNYHAFYIHDPKQRHIHKAQVSDRVVHHLLYKYLYRLFDITFIYNSYSCRLNKGTHKGVKRLGDFTRRVGQNYTKDCWILKCDIKRFFASVDHKILLNLLRKRINDEDIFWLISQVVDSFHTEEGKGIPLGNLTSQVFANVYLNELDQYVKHELKVKYYIRYADDFLLLNTNKYDLEKFLGKLTTFCGDHLKLQLHPDKIIFRKLEWGIDFLGYIVLPHYKLPRTKTKKRIIPKLKLKINAPNFEQSLQSYLGYLSHANSFKLTQDLKNQFYLNTS